MGVSFFVQVGRWSYWVGIGFTRIRRPRAFLGAGRDREENGGFALGLEWVT